MEPPFVGARVRDTRPREWQSSKAKPIQDVPHVHHKGIISEQKTSQMWGAELELPRGKRLNLEGWNVKRLEAHAGGCGNYGDVWHGCY